MAEVGISVAAKIAEYLVGPALRHGKYLFCAGKISRNVESTKEELTSTWERMQKCVEDARNRAEEVDDAVERWLNKVKSVMEEVEKLEQEMKEGGSFFRGWCPTLKGYHICKQLSKKTNTMADLSQNSKFNPFSHRAPVPDIDYFSSGDFVYFKSTKLASQELLEALKDDSIYMIGLYGMGGCGKTTLVKEVGKKAKESKLFNRVAFTTVSQTVDVRKIQGEIADLLDFKFGKETEAGRARELSVRLESGERILVILDDVWSKLKLVDIGIPLDSHHKGCKVLLTTRRLQVCTLMDCQRKIPLNLLSEKDAWTLFRKHADIVDEASDRLLNGVAQEVAWECKGLPIAIVAVATSLKGRKFLDHWNVALHKLRVSERIDVDEGERDVYACLRLSYDYLRREEAKFLFLMCSMFPEDHDISIEELFRYGMGLGICRGVDSFEIARSKVNVAIEDLIDSSLLMPSEKYNGEKCLKMHDMFRNVALWIASKEIGTIMVDPAKDLNALFEDGSMKDCYAVSWWHKKINRFPQQLDAPSLGFILINSVYDLNLSYASFEGIKELKVMAVINNINQYLKGLLVLPQSTQWFNNLRTLRLVGQEIGDISFVVSLRRLKILDLQQSTFKAVPIGIENLNELKLLDLSFCKIEEDCYEVIGRCSQLVELYMWGTVTLPYEFFWNDVAILRLQRYTLEIGNLRWWPPTISSMKAVHLGGLNMFNSGASIKVLLQRADFVLLEELKGGCKSIIPEMVQAVGGMKDLTTLILRSNSVIECIIDTTTSDYDNSFRVDAEFPMLFRLELSKAYNLKEVCRGPPLLCILEKLESLDINDCSQLHRIFSGNWKLCNLKSLKIHNCAKLTSLFPVENGTDAVEEEIFPNLESISDRGCHKLEYIFPGECNLCSLKTLDIDSCVLLTSLFSISVAQTLVLLEEVTIENCNELQCVFGEQNIGYGSSCQNEIEIVLPVLKRLSLINLPKLVNVFPKNFRLPSLIELSCTNCTKLTTLCKYSMVGSELRPLHSNMGSDAAIANVSQSSNELSFIWMDSPKILSFQYLQQLQVTGCEKVKSIFSTTISKSLLELTELVISYCGELEEIMSENEEPQNLSNTQLCFPKLKRLEVVRCNKLKYLFSTSTSIMLSQLEYLKISEAAQLEQAFRYRNEVGTDSMEKIMLPKLRTVELEKLPNFVDISQGLKLHVMGLYRIVVDECPKFAPVLAQKISLHQWRTELMEVQAQAINDGQVSNEGSYLQPASTIEEEQKKIIASNVESLELRNLPDLMFIWKGPTLISFQNLVDLKVDGCSKMKSIFSAAIITSLPKLQELTIEDCEELEEIISSNAEGPTLISFQHLVYLKVVGCSKLKSIFSAAIITSLPKLQELTIVRCEELEEIISSNAEGPTLISFQNLVGLNVLRCSKLKSIFSAAIITSLPKLRDLYIEHCEELEEIISSNAEGPTLISFQDLVDLKVIRCSKLKSIFSAAIITSLPKLRVLYIVHCEELEEIISSNAEGGECHCIISPKSCPQQVCFPELARVTVGSCNKMKFLFPCSMAEHLKGLKFLVITRASQLEHVFSCARETHDHDGDGIKSKIPSLTELEISHVPRFGGLLPPRNAHNPGDELNFKSGNATM